MHPTRPPPATIAPPAPFHAVADALAARQHGIVSRPQLLAAGVPPHIVDQRVRSGRLHVVHRGVYRLGPLVTPDSRLMAACLACGPTALISHLSAGVRWGMLHWLDPPEVVDVAGPRLYRRRPGIRIHRCRSLRRGDRTRLAGIPMTTAARTLMDLAPLLTDRALERAAAEALARGLLSERSLQAAVRRCSGHAGAPRLREVTEGPPARTRSEAEERLLALIRAACLAEPRLNVTVAGLQVDFFWPEAGLVAEVDGFGPHGSRRAYERDRRRDQVLLARGIRVMRVTWRQITDDPGGVLSRLGRALRHGRP